MSVQTDDARLRDLSPLWLSLVFSIRLATTATAIALLAIHRVTDHDDRLIVIAAVYTAVVVLAVRRWTALTLSPVAWGIDIAAVLALVIASEDWRSPFYLMALTALAAPAAALRPAAAVVLGGSFSAAYVVIAHFIGPDPVKVGAQTTVETLATHLVLPLLVAFGISYAADVVRRLRSERRRSERLAIEAERRRIAWELHDSAKQRVHASHLVLSSIGEIDDERLAGAVGQVLGELRAALGDMDTSLAELRTPLEGRPLEVAIRERAAALSVPGGPRIEVHGDAPPLAPLQAAHAFRIASEAITNAVRHSEGTRVDVELSVDGRSASVVVADDGRGMPEIQRPGANGLRAMRYRASTIGGKLSIGAASGGGTRVELLFPINQTQGDLS